jgi:hypothetical protein
MDPLILLVLVIFAVLVIIVLGQRAQRGGQVPDDSTFTEETFEFPEDAESLKPTARRNTSIVAPMQSTASGMRKLAISALPLPDLSSAIPPPEKGIDAILVTVLNPDVRFADTDAEVYDFDPVLRVTVNYKPEDRDATTMEDGKPRLSLATVFESEGGWRFERLATAVVPDAEGGGGTLSALLETLQPDDPVVMCRP